MKSRAGVMFLCTMMGFSIQSITAQDARLSPTYIPNTLQQTHLRYWTFDPLVISSSGTQNVSLHVQTDGPVPKVKLVLANGSVKQLVSEGGGKFSIILLPADTLHAQWQKYVKRNYVGQLDLGGGEVYPLSIGVDDGSIPEVSVLDLDETTRISPRIVNFLIPGVNPAQVNLAEVTRLFYQHFPDEFDFINIVTTAADSRGSYFINVSNSTLGLGLELFDRTSTFGSSGRLEGIVGIPNPMHLDLASSEYLRMLGYNWMNYSQHPYLAGATPHWPISTLANGIMGYQDQRSDEFRPFPYYIQKEWVGFFPLAWWTGDYILKTKSSPPFFNYMEQYLMGLIPASQVPSNFILKNQNQAICNLCKLKGPVVTFDIDHLQSDLGSRVPDAATSRKNFRVATIVVSNDRLLSPQEIRHFDFMAERGEATGELPYSKDDITGFTNPFRTATSKKGTLEALITNELGPNINEGLNGSWYDPELPGQGFFINVLPASKRMFIGWFTYETWRREPRESRMGDAYQRWMTAVGEYYANRANLTLYRTTGGEFNSTLPTENTEIGTLVFKIEDCGHLNIEYDIDVDDRLGQISLSRIAGDNAAWCEELQSNPSSMLPATSATSEARVVTADRARQASRPAETEPASVATDSFRITEGLNGAWFNPDWPGQGFFIDVLPVQQQVFAGWFTFDTERLYANWPSYSLGDPNQRWLTASGEFQGNQAHLELVLTSGGELLSKQAPVTNQEYGTLDLEFSDCETAIAHYTIPELAMEGTIPLKRISNENTETCQLRVARPPPKNTVSTIDDGQNKGGIYSMATGSDGLPLISYVVNSERTLKLIKCNDRMCSGFNVTISDIGNRGLPSQAISSIAIGIDGLPIIAYSAESGNRNTLTIVRCHDLACAGGDEENFHVDPAEFQTGFGPSIAIGTDGFPVISHTTDRDDVRDLRVTKCNDAECSGADEASTTVLAGVGGGSTVLAIGKDGFPVIANYYNELDQVIVVKCTDRACASGSETTSVVAQEVNGDQMSMAIAKDGFPMLIIPKFAGRGSILVKCNDPACAGADESVSMIAEVNESNVYYPSIAIGTDGNPVIAYLNQKDTHSQAEIIVIACNDPACSGNDETRTIVGEGLSGLDWLTMIIGSDGLPIMSYYDTTGIAGSLKILHCGEPDCSP
ncbi:hypothetical protein ACFL00_04290 [Pseudomonadota bacterium]